jgi:hypothetical protein
MLVEGRPSLPLPFFMSDHEYRPIGSDQINYLGIAAAALQSDHVGRRRVIRGQSSPDYIEIRSKLLCQF